LSAASTLWSINESVVPKNVLYSSFRPTFALSKNSNASSIIAVDEAVRSDVIVDFKYLDFCRGQPSQGQVNIARKNLPNGLIAQLNNMAVGMINNFQLLLRWVTIPNPRRSALFRVDVTVLF
jgi:hypothetical protein